MALLASSGVNLQLSLEWLATQRKAAGMRNNNSKTMDKQWMKIGWLLLQLVDKVKALWERRVLCYNVVR